MATQAPPAEAGPSQPSPVTSTAAAPSDATDGKKQPTVIICIGMAGSVSADVVIGTGQSLITHRVQGKTTLMQRLNSHLHSRNSPPYILNLDPAVTHMPYSANIDIRDTVDYKEVMKQ